MQKLNDGLAILFSLRVLMLHEKSLVLVTGVYHQHGETDQATTF